MLEIETILILKVKKLSAHQSANKYFNTNRKKHEDYKCESIPHYLKPISMPTDISKQPNILFFFISVGSIEISAGGEYITGTTGDIIIIQEKKPYSIINASNNINGYVLTLNGEGTLGSMGDHSLIFNLEFLETWSTSKYSISKLPHRFIENIFDRLTWESQSESEKLTIVNAYVITLLLEMNHLYNAAFVVNKPAIDITRKFKALVHQTLAKPISLKEMANQLAVSPNHLNKSVKTITGRSASELANSIKTFEAKYMLMLADININEVARQLGFEDPSYFSRFFKKHTGLTPKEFSNRIDLSQ